jgi:DNA-directed RNA polymerase subunit RPC12/RpoP
MATLADYKCPCGNVFEEMAGRVTTCPKCGGIAHRIISLRGSYREDAPWLASVLEVVDKEGVEPETKAFLASPTRSNWKAWMKVRGLRPHEEGERPTPQHKDQDHRALTDQIMKRHQERKTLVVR